MPRSVLWLIFLLTCTSVFSQTQVNRSPPSATAADARLKAIYNFYVPKGQDTGLNGGLDSVGALFYKIPDSTLWVRVGTNNHNHWQLVGSGSSSASSDSLFNGNRPITRDFSTITGVNLGTTTKTATLDKLLYPSQPPTASLTGGSTLELMASGATLPFTLSWTAGRLASTATISTISVAGFLQTFSQPAAGATVSGTQAVSVTRNVNTSFSNIVTTSDGKTAPATVNYIFSPKRYFGWVNSTTPSDGEILATTAEFSTSFAKSWIQSQPTGSQNLVFAYPSSEGALTQIIINGFPSIEAFELTQRAFVNALGYSQVYNIYASTNKFSATGTTTVVTQ